MNEKYRVVDIVNKHGGIANKRSNSLEALMRKCKQSVHSRLCGNDMETSRGASAEIRGRRPGTLMSEKELTDQDEMSNRNRGLSIDASYQVSVHLAKWNIIGQSRNTKITSEIGMFFV
jgi:hypothetical protein